MDFRKHFGYENRHSFLSPSKYHWIRYPDEKIRSTFSNYLEAQRGTELHDLAKNLILLGVKLPANGKTLSRYVNDAIGWKLTPEQILFVSPNCFGTADALGFKNDVLRVSDLKNGVTKASFDQLRVYAAMFCLEYGYLPAHIKIELRIYQNDDVEMEIAETADITHIMDRIKTADKIIEEMKAEVL